MGSRDLDDLRFEDRKPICKRIKEMEQRCEKKMDGFYQQMSRCTGGGYHNQINGREKSFLRVWIRPLSDSTGDYKTCDKG